LKQFSLRRFGLLALLAFSANTVPCLEVSAEEIYQTYDTPRFTLHIGSEREPVKALSDQEYTELAQDALKTLNGTFEELSRVFKLQPVKKVVLRFLTPQEFTRMTGAPKWTNAMYYRGEISIPLTAQNIKKRKDLVRAVRHEYVHAFLAEVTRHRCPAWLDEGLAQLIEGKPNPLLGPALREWLASNEAIPLDWLRNGFTLLDEEVVPTAYAQSLFVARSLVNQHGFSAMRSYMLELRDGRTHDQAFETAFGLDKSSYEKQLNEELDRWKFSGKRHP